MSSTSRRSTRREFIGKTGKVAAAAALASAAAPRVHAAENNTIQLALIGCGGRGTGAVHNAFSGNNGPVKLVAMADVFPARIAASRRALSKRNKYADLIDVPPERRFVGFDAYRNAMDCLKPGDVAIFATPPAFRWVHFAHAVEKGLNVFMEKPVTVDAPTTHKMRALAEEADKKNLKVGVGLMVRHSDPRRELFQRVKDGEIGDIITLRAYRMHGPIYGYYGPNNTELSDLLYQVKQFHGFLWASGGTFSDFYIHQIDECCWMKDAWPIKAQAVGGRHYRGDCVDQNFDNYSVEYIFADGARLFLHGRSINGCHQQMDSYAHGTKGLGVVSSSGHYPGKCRTYKGHNQSAENLIWEFPQPENHPYTAEWEGLIDAVRRDKPYNEARRGAEASLITSMGRMAAHTGKVVTYEEISRCDHEFAPDVDKLTMDSPAPLLADANGKYPVPRPGIVTDREYRSP